MFDSGRPCLIDHREVGWTAEDDEMVAALTEEALAEAGNGVGDDDAGSAVPELPIEVLATLLTGPRAPRGAGLVAAMRAQARMVAHHQARLLEAMMAIVDEYSALDDYPAVATEAAAVDIRLGDRPGNVASRRHRCAGGCRARARCRRGPDHRSDPGTDPASGYRHRP